MSDATNPTPPHVSAAFDLDRIMRSQVLYEAIALEDAVERIIAVHFCPADDKQDMFVSLLFREGEVSFSRKIRMLKKILKFCYPDLAKAFAFLPKRLDTLRQLRNDFAHLPLDIPSEPTTANLNFEEIQLRTIKDGQKSFRRVSQQEVDAMVRQCRDLEMAALFLATVIRKAARGKLDPELTSMVSELGEQIGKRVAASTTPP